MIQHLTKRQAILVATLRLAVEHDIQATSMSRIAQEAGVGMGTIYNYFDSKQDLLAELYQELRQKLRVAIRAGFPHDGTYRERFLHVWRTLARYYRDHPDAFLFESRFETSPYVGGAEVWQSDDFWDELNALFDEARDRGVLEPIRLEYFLPMVRGAIGELVRSHIAGRVQLDDSAIEDAITYFWRSVAVEPAPIAPAAGHGA